MTYFSILYGVERANRTTDESGILGQSLLNYIKFFNISVIALNNLQITHFPKAAMFFTDFGSAGDV